MLKVEKKKKKKSKKNKFSQQLPPSILFDMNSEKIEANKPQNSAIAQNSPPPLFSKNSEESTFFLGKLLKLARQKG